MNEKISKEAAIEKLISIDIDSDDKKDYASEINVLADENLIMDDVLKFLNFFKKLSLISSTIEELKLKIERNESNIFEVQLRNNERKVKNISLIQDSFFEIIRKNEKTDAKLLGQLLNTSLKLMSAKSELVAKFGFDFFITLHIEKKIELTAEQKIIINKLFSEKLQDYDETNFKFVTKILFDKKNNLSTENIKYIANNLYDFDEINKKIADIDQKIFSLESEINGLEGQKSSHLLSIEEETDIPIITEMSLNHTKTKIENSRKQLARYVENFKEFSTKRKRLLDIKEYFLQIVNEEENISSESELGGFIVKTILGNITVKSSNEMKNFGFELLEILYSKKSTKISTEQENEIKKQINENLLSNDKVTAEFLLRIFTTKKDFPISNFSTKGESADLSNIITVLLSVQKKSKKIITTYIPNILEFSYFDKTSHLDLFIDLFLELMGSNIAETLWEKILKLELTTEQEIKIREKVIERLKLNRAGLFEIKILSEQKCISTNVDAFCKILTEFDKNVFSIAQQDCLYSNQEINFLFKVALKVLQEEKSNNIKKIAFKIVANICSHKQQIFDEIGLALLIKILSIQYDVKKDNVVERWKNILLNLCANTKLTAGNIEVIIEQLFIWLEKDADGRYLRTICVNFEVIHNNPGLIIKLLIDKLNTYDNNVFTKGLVYDVLDIKSYYPNFLDPERGGLIKHLTVKDVIQYIDEYVKLSEKGQNTELLTENIKFLWFCLQKMAQFCSSEDLQDFFTSVMQNDFNENVLLVLSNLLINKKLVADKNENIKDTIVKCFLNGENNNKIFIFPKLFSYLDASITECNNVHDAYKISGPTVYYYGSANSLDLKDVESGFKKFFQKNEKFEQLIFQIDILKRMAKELNLSEQITLSIKKTIQKFETTVENDKAYGRIAWIQIFQGLSENKNLEGKHITSIINTISENLNIMLEKDTKYSFTSCGLMGQPLENPCFLAAKVFLTLVKGHHKKLTEEQVDILSQQLNIFMKTYDVSNGKNFIELKKEIEMFDSCMIKLSNMKIKFKSIKEDKIEENEKKESNYVMKFTDNYKKRASLPSNFGTQNFKLEKKN